MIETSPDDARSEAPLEEKRYRRWRELRGSVKGVGYHSFDVAALALCSLSQGSEGRRGDRHGYRDFDFGVAGLDVNLGVGELRVEGIGLVIV